MKSYVRHLGIALFGCLLFVPGARSEEEVYQLDQGWTPQERAEWYALSQGSRLIEKSWLLALKNADGTAFFTRSAMEDFGFIYADDSDGALPIGIVADDDESVADGREKWIGLNCAACHTSKLHALGDSVLVEGGSTIVDLQDFTTKLIAAVERTTAIEEDFKLFSSTVLGEKADGESREKLIADMSSWLAHRKPINGSGANAHWGRGRADAVGIILATTAAVVSGSAQVVEDQGMTSDAPVSFPFIWNTNQQGRLQHNGIVDNGTDLGLAGVAKIGALIRNWTEALGVFAEVKLSEDGNTVTSSIRKDNLLRLEQLLAKLQSPRWPAQFGALDETKRLRGAKLFMANCASCHGDLKPGDNETFLPLVAEPQVPADKLPRNFVYLQPVLESGITSASFKKTLTPSPWLIGTDPAMTCNAILHKSPSGRFEGKQNVKGMVPLPGQTNFGEYAFTTDLLRVLIQQDIKSNKAGGIAAYAENQFAALQHSWWGGTYTDLEYDSVGEDLGDDPLVGIRTALQICADRVSDLRAADPEYSMPQYKARPLNGIWATAPYLHNGSVPTLHDLLLPQPQRPRSFAYRDGTLDLVKAGLADGAAVPGAFTFDVYDAQGQAIPGNWNGGHEYGVNLSGDEKMDLVEYLKGL